MELADPNSVCKYHLPLITYAAMRRVT